MAIHGESVQSKRINTSNNSFEREAAKSCVPQAGRYGTSND